LTFLILAAFQRAILHPGFSTLPIHHYASQFLKSPSSTFHIHISMLSHFTILLPSTTISHFTTSYRPELGFICPPLYMVLIGHISCSATLISATSTIEPIISTLKMGIPPKCQY